MLFRSFFHIFPGGEIQMLFRANYNIDVPTNKPAELYYSGDMGETWDSRVLPGDTRESSDWYYADFLDPDTGWLMQVNGGEVFFTEDGGRSWVSLTSVNWTGQLHFISRDLGWAVAWPLDDYQYIYYYYPWQYGLLHTSDGGRTWEQFSPVLATP